MEALSIITPRAAKPARGAFSEDAAARSFAECFAGRLKYDHHRGRWFRWTGTRWQVDEIEHAFQRVRDHVIALATRADEKACREAARLNFAKHVEQFARGDGKIATTSNGWDSDPWLLGTPCGTVDLRTGELGPADPDDNITLSTGFTPAADAACPRWLQFISEVTQGDEGYSRFLSQVAGYALTGDTREHSLFYAHGAGGNGKSVFINLMSRLLGDYATTASMDVFIAASGNNNHPTELARLRGARLVTASETEEGRAWAEARVKALTGGDRIAARFMRQDFFEYTPTFKLLIVGNHKPTLRSVDDAARRRFNLLPFDFKPPAPDRELERTLLAEAPAILRWAINGCLDWQARGLVRPDVVKAATADYFEAQDMLGQFLEEQCDVDPGNSYKTERSADVFFRWSEFAKAASEPAGSRKAFAEKLKGRGVQSSRTRDARLFVGIRLKQAPAQWGEA
jgi:putative DNA primase/helicase